MGPGEINDGRPRSARGVWALAVLVILAVTAAVWIAAHRYFVSEELQRAEARLSLYRSTVLAEVERFAHLTQVLSVDPFVIDALAAEPPEVLNRRLAEFAEAAGIDAIFLMRPDGGTIAASNAERPGSFVGQNYGFRPYFQEALAGGRGTFYGIGATTGLPGYFIADAVRDDTGAVIGVVAVKIDLVPFEQSWRAAGEQVFLANADGVILLASDAGWRYRALAPLSAAERAEIDAARQFTGQTLDPLDWVAGDGVATIEGEARLHLVSTALPHGWRLHYLADDAPAVTRATLLAGIVVVLGGLGLIGAQYLRGRRLKAALHRSEGEERALREANRALAREIEERRVAEQRLDVAREELDRASRLAALGQLSASVTHELGQPIAAMRNHLAAAEMTGGDGRLVGRIGGLVDRMEGITRQLKFFARSDGEAFEDVDLGACVDAALDLLAPAIEAEGVEVVRIGEGPMIVRGARLRLEQVLTNLLRNGLDAMDGTQAPRLEVRFGHDDAWLWVEVADTGHGLGDATLSELSEPFVTTRESGRGMGLGLAISSGILDDHQGRLEARNRDGGGAVFRMVLPRPAAQDIAAQ